jgi:dTDP-4-dehydrorhamnose 3,5-epimerase
MRFTQTRLPGVMLIDVEKLEDTRGFFARTWCGREFAQQGLAAELAQASIAFNRKKGTLRGIHFQAPPRREARLLRCTAGAAFVVVLDLRPRRQSFKHSIDVVLRRADYRALYVPPGLGVGYQTLEDNTEIFYQMSEYYEPSASAGVRWNDPAFGIEWPDDQRIILERDNQYADFDAYAVQGFAEY